MAYTNSEMALIDYSGTLKLFAYGNTAGDTVTTANFFDAGAEPQNLMVGDLILNKANGELYRVSAIADGAVTVTQTS